jgi:NADH-quinone oxidoreductase subunit L
MSDPILIVKILGLVAVAAPAALFALLGIASLLDRKLAERSIASLCHIANVVGLVASGGVFTFMIATGERHIEVDLGDWVTIETYRFSVSVVFDRLSVPFLFLTFGLCGIVGVFASRYMHRERGYNRFFVLYAMFVFGMVLAILSGTIETLFAGWEMVGLSSALLIAFFHERPAPPRNGLRVWVVYRISDAALLIGAVAFHHYAGTGQFHRLLGPGAWPDGKAQIAGQQALLVGLLLLIAAAGKSALIPFSGWLPRAMEGPTASSAVFYGALSVHLGAYLLLRVSPLIDESAWLAAAIIAIGLSTALYAYIAGSVQTDIKSALSFASLAQVGLIVAEIGVGFRYIALAHLLGHACLRTMQFLRAPTLLHDYHTMENAIGEHLPPPGGPLGRLLPDRARVWLYRYALERGYIDMWLTLWIVRPFVGTFRFFDRMERVWTNLLAGQVTRRDAAAGGRFDELT